MGTGGRMTEKECAAQQGDVRPLDDPLCRVPHEKPPFMLGQIKNAISPHCFHLSALRSFSYVVHDLAIAGFLLSLVVAGIPSLPVAALRLLAWPLFWVAQGCVLTGFWVIAHECGHHAFSDSSLLGDL